MEYKYSFKRPQEITNCKSCPCYMVYEMLGQQECGISGLNLTDMEDDYISFYCPLKLESEQDGNET